MSAETIVRRETPLELMLEVMDSVIIARERLRDVEWVSQCSGEGVRYCPACRSLKTEGHDENCWLGNALAGRG